MSEGRADRLRKVPGRWSLGASVALALFLFSQPVSAQRFGQWSWDGSAGASRRSYANALDELTIGDADQTELELALGLNGFIVHPAFARFRLILDAGLDSFRTVRSVDTRRWGFGAYLNMFPMGAFPLHVYARRQRYDYSGVSAGDPLLLAGVPETTQAYGGRLRLRHGFLRGTLLGYAHSTLSYASPERAPTVFENLSLRWNRSGRRQRRDLRVEQRQQDFGSVGFGTRDLTMIYDQRGPLAAGWTWQNHSLGVRRDIEFQDRSSRVDSLRSSQHLTRKLAGNDTVSLRYDGGFVQTTGNTAQSHLVVARYWWRPRGAWTVSPSVGYGLQSQDEASMRSPQLSLGTSWRRQLRSLDLTFSNNLTYLHLMRSGAGGERTDSTMGLEVLVSASQGRTFRRDLSLTWSRQQLRQSGESITELPDLGASLAGLGTESRLRGRLTLAWSWRGFAVHAYSDGQRRAPEVRFAGQAPVVSTLTNTLQVARGDLVLTANLARSGVAAVGERPRQSLASWSSALSWRPLRLLSLGASYSSLQRNLNLGPDLDIRRIEARADLRLGAIVIRGQGFRSAEQRPEFPERINEGFSVSLLRRFGGWLPIVTAPQSGGVIR